MYMSEICSEQINIQHYAQKNEHSSSRTGRL